MKFQIVASAALLMGLASFSSQAVDNGIYLGAGIGQGGVQFDESINGDRIDFDADDTAFKLIAGWRFLDWLSVEANYVDLGSASDRIEGIDIETDVSGVSLAAVGFLPLGPVDLFAKVGAVNWDADVTARGLGISGSDSGTDLAYGAGAQFRVWSLSIRGEYEIFDVADVDTVDLISLSVTWTFL
jgi:opacity protein-like surface antigen